MKVEEKRLRERIREKKERERRVGEDKVEEDTDFNLWLGLIVTIQEVKLREGLGLLNWSCRGPLSILVFKILFKSTAISKD